MFLETYRIRRAEWPRGHKRQLHSRAIYKVLLPESTILQQLPSSFHLQHRETQLWPRVYLACPKYHPQEIICACRRRQPLRHESRSRTDSFPRTSPSNDRSRNCQFVSCKTHMNVMLGFCPNRTPILIILTSDPWLMLRL